MANWKKLQPEEIRQRVFSALEQNVNYYEANILGVPASHLDEKVFNQSASFLKDAPFLTTMLRNPNHIGCHTLGESEHFFAGTQKLEIELITICAEDILKAQPGQTDGYVAAGGTEANMQAVWIYRNYFRQNFQARDKEIALLCTSDSHYSMAKAADVLHVKLYRTNSNKNKSVDKEALDTTLDQMRADGIRYVIVVANMMTTMYGSVDDPAIYTDALRRRELPFKLHIDGAYGGFYYPFSNPTHTLDFSNPDISSITLDAHKMVQAPYGTGIFLARKGLMQYARTPEASYIEGEDFTLIGSRSGANAVAVWMILVTYGRYGWEEKIMILQKRADWLANQLRERNIRIFQENQSNIVTIHADHIAPDLAVNFGLVPDNHHHPQWYKVVVMEHVTVEKMEPLVAAIEKHNA